MQNKCNHMQTSDCGDVNNLTSERLTEVTHLHCERKYRTNLRVRLHSLQSAKVLHQERQCCYIHYSIYL